MRKAMMSVLAIAMLCHSANAAYCASIGDDSQVPWDQAPDWQRESAIKGVEFCLANPDAPASANHDSWMAEKVAAGWVYGEVKDPEASPPTHPCIVAFDDLPVEQQFKDVLFKTIVAGCSTEGDDIATWHPEFVAAMSQDRVDLEGQVASLTKERDAAEARADKAEKATKAAKAKVAQGEPPAKARTVKPIDDGLSGDELEDALRKADDAEKKVEIVFSDGKRELTGIPPKVVTGDVWRKHARGLMLRDPITVDGPSQGEASFGIAGYGLLIDGKQVAWCERADKVNVGAGQQVGLSDDIYF